MKQLRMQLMRWEFMMSKKKVIYFVLASLLLTNQVILPMQKDLSAEPSPKNLTNITYEQKQILLEKLKKRVLLYKIGAVTTGTLSGLGVGFGAYKAGETVVTLAALITFMPIIIVLTLPLTVFMNQQQRDDFYNDLFNFGPYLDQNMNKALYSGIFGTINAYLCWKCVKKVKEAKNKIKEIEETKIPSNN
jgi:hypothetical protein